MQTSRVRPAAWAAELLAHTRLAGTIASSNGTLSVTPKPRRTVRREMCFWVMNIA
jgi:hypothetical protein